MRSFICCLLSLVALAVAAESPVDLADQVSIRRTEYGVPHILADNEKAAAYGFAWAQCEDHFPIVYKSVVRGRSEVSRWYGASEGNVEYDFQTRQLRARKRVVDNFHRLPADYRSVLTGFAAGINAYMAAHPEEREDWMTPVTPHDVGCAWQVAVMRFTFLRGNVIGRLKRAMEQGENTEAALEMVSEAPMGSNTIALSPARTKNGHALLLNNPHQPWSEEANYYEAHLTVPGVYNFYGSTFAGGPILSTGFNDNLGWSHTVNHPDLYELYEVTLDPAQPDHYLFDGGSIPLEHEVVTILTEGDTPLQRDCWWSPLGPVIHRNDTSAFILRSVGYEQYQTGVQWYRMTKAQNLEEFRAVLAMQEIPMFNVSYADRAGNIMYLWNGTVPDLPHPAHGNEAVPVRSTDEVWTRIHPVGELMQHINPVGGYVQNCNSPPYLTNLHLPLKREDYPAHFPDNDLSLRTQHGLGLIHNDTKFDLESLMKAKFSMNMLLADRVKPDLLKILGEADLNDEERAAWELLKRWENSVRAESKGSVLFKVWWSLYRKGDNRYAEDWDEATPMSTPFGIGAPERVLPSFREAMAECTRRWGSWDVAWGDVHRIRRGDVDLPVGGGDGELGCFRVCDFTEGEDGRYEMNGGDGYVFVVEFGDTPKAWSVLAYSQSGRPDSPHYNDQTPLFANNQMKPVAFTEGEINAQLLRTYRPGSENK